VISGGLSLAPEFPFPDAVSAREVWIL